MTRFRHAIYIRCFVFNKLPAASQFFQNGDDNFKGINIQAMSYRQIIFETIIQ